MKQIFKPIFASVFAVMMAQSALALDFDGAWKHQKFPLRSGNQFGLNGSSLNIVSDGGVSLVYRPFFQPASSASWNWSVNQSVPVTNLKSKGGDDRNIAIYFVFMPAAEAEKAKGQGITKVLSNPAAKALIYTYGGQDPEGTSYQSPYTGGRGMVITKAAAGTGSGQTSVSLVDDYQAAYGAAPEVLVGIAVSADSDDTKAAIRAELSSMRVR